MTLLVATTFRRAAITGSTHGSATKATTQSTSFPDRATAPLKLATTATTKGIVEAAIRGSKKNPPYQRER